MKSSIALLFAAALFTSAPILQAEEATAERKAAADKLLRVMKVDEGMKSAFDQMTEMQKATIAQQVEKPEEREKALRAAEAATGPLREELAWEKVGGMFVEIYAEVFTKEELEALVKFYESPSGQKFVEKQPQLQAATMQRMQALMMEVMPKIQARVQAELTPPATEPAKAGDAATPAAE